MKKQTIVPETVVGNLPGAIYQCTKLNNGTVVVNFVSEGIKNLLGVTAEEVISSKKNFLEWSHPDDQVGINRAHEISASEMTLLSQQCRFHTPDGREIRVRFVARPRHDEDGLVIWDGLMLDAADSEDNAPELRRRQSILEATAFAAEQFLRQLKWESCVEAVLARLGEAMDVSRVYIFENVSSQGGELMTARRFEWTTLAFKPQIDPSPPGAQVVSYRSIGLAHWQKKLSGGGAIAGNADDFPAEEKRFLQARGIESILVVPVHVGSLWWGFIGFDNCCRRRQWLNSEIDALTAAASTLGAAIQREMASLELKRAYQQEINIGLEIQTKLLLGRTPIGLDGAEVAALSIPSQQIDGDFYDFVIYDKQHFDLFIGDVMGKGVSAALLGAAIKTQFIRAISNLVCSTNLATLPTPEEIVNFTHGEMCDKLINLNSFVTADVARFNLDKRRIDIVDCGHPPVIHYCSGTGKCQAIKSENFPLGFGPDEIYHQHTIHFDMDDIFLFYSDGLIEIKDSEDKIFGIGSLMQFVEENASLDPKNLVRKLYSRLIHFSPTPIFPDDLTYIVVKIEDTLKTATIKTASREFEGKLEKLDSIRSFVREICYDTPGADIKFIGMLELASSEACSNIIQHAYRDKPNGKIICAVRVCREHIAVELQHWGKSLTTFQMNTPAFDGSQDSGYGLYFIRNCVDEVFYSDGSDGKSTIRLIKSIKR